MSNATTTKKLAIIIDSIDESKFASFKQRLSELGFELKLLEKNCARAALLQKFKNLISSDELIDFEAIRKLEPEFDLIIKVDENSRSLEDSVIIGASYAEIYFANMDAADFNLAELEKAISDFENRKRNFGA